MSCASSNCLQVVSLCWEIEVLSNLFAKLYYKEILNEIKRTKIYVLIKCVLITFIIMIDRANMKVWFFCQPAHSFDVAVLSVTSSRDPFQCRCGNSVFVALLLPLQFQIHMWHSLRLGKIDAYMNIATSHSSVKFNGTGKLSTLV